MRGPSRQSWDHLFVDLLLLCGFIVQDVLAYVQGDILDQSAAAAGGVAATWHISNGKGLFSLCAVVSLQLARRI